jgi:hypothetical protein
MRPLHQDLHDSRIAFFDHTPVQNPLKYPRRPVREVLEIPQTLVYSLADVP